MTVTELQPYTIGASSVPAILNLDPFDSAYALGARMLDKREKPMSDAMQHGLDSEAWHASLVEAAGYDLMPAPAAGFTHPDLPWLCVHPDGIVGLDGLASPLELKLRGIAPSDAIRTRDTVQSLVQVHVMAATQGLVSVVHGGFGGVRRDEWKVDADEDLFGLVVDRCERFLSLLRRGQLPAPDGGDASRDAIRTRFASGVGGKCVRATQEVWAHVRRGREYAAQEATAKRLKEREYQHVQDFMGDAVELISPYDTLAARWTPTTRTSLDAKALRAAHPDLAGEFDKVTSSRRFEANPA